MLGVILPGHPGPMPLTTTARPLPATAPAVPHPHKPERVEGPQLGAGPQVHVPSPRAIGARGNTAELVGTPQQVAEVFLDYHALGVTTFLIRGFDPLEEALEYGRTLPPLTRRPLASHTQHQTVAE